MSTEAIINGNIGEQKMKSTKMKTAILAISLGLGIGLSGIVAATPIEEACKSFIASCANGDQFACDRVKRFC